MVVPSSGQYYGGSTDATCWRNNHKSKANSFKLLQEAKASIIDDLLKDENSKNVTQPQYRLLRRYKLIRNGEDEQLVKRTKENVATTKPRKF